MILLIDNYDSFSYNLVQLIGSIIKEKAIIENKAPEEIMVIRNDEITAEDIKKLNPSHIILSPGPGRPSDAGVCEEAVKVLKGRIPILGVCLGHQGICEAFGGVITYANTLMHGKQSLVKLDTISPLFQGLNEEITVGRYHSLAVCQNNLPDELTIIAMAYDGDIMAVKHRDYDIYGVQFHPESVLTPNGRRIMENFLDI